MINLYQVGGSLSVDAPTYINRQADRELLTYLEQGDFCYVFNSRQMGKSSLLIHTKQILQAKGWQTANLDMTMLGSELITAKQWYWGMIFSLWRAFKLQKYLDFNEWSVTKQDISFVQILSQFIEEVLFQYLAKENIVIFIDEIDSILSLNFPTDDFFAFIRFCYNQRANNPIYQRLTFALFGVATPADLITDKKRTPFNIGRAINLTGFQISEALPLIQGFPDWLEAPEIILQEIINWTEGQPFLTQKICRIVSECSYQQNFAMQFDTPRVWVASLIKSFVINNWESQDQPEHLQTMRNRLNYHQQRKGRLLGIYQQILQNQSVVYDDSREQTELILSGLVIRQDNHLQVKNRIYAEVFNLNWVNQELEVLRPYSQTFSSWLTTGKQDSSRLLRGQALKDALLWSQGKSLSDLDYQFLAASTEIDRQESQQKLEAEKTKIITQQLKEEQKHLEKERKNNRRQKILLMLTSVAFFIASGSALIARYAYRQSSISEIRTLVASSQGLFASFYQLESMLAAIAAKEKYQQLSLQDEDLREKVETVLNQTVYSNNEANRLIGHRGEVLTVDISADDQLIATAGQDKIAKIWGKDGRLLQNLEHSATIHRLVFTPDSQKLITSSLNGKIYIWSVNGQLIRTIDENKSPIWGIDVSPDGQYIATGSSDYMVKIWNIEGKLEKTLQGHEKAVWSVAFSPNGETLASVSANNQVILWNRNGDLLHEMTDHQGPIWDVAFCTNDILVSVSGDKTMRIWNTNGQLQTTVTNSHPFFGVDCRANMIATSSSDYIIKMWRFDGSLIKELKKHRSLVKDVAINSNGKMGVSTGNDGILKVWQRSQRLLRRIYAHSDVVWGLATNHSVDKQLIASISLDNTLKLWNDQGILLTKIIPEQSGFRAVKFMPNQPIMVTGSNNRLVQLWDISQASQSKIKLLKNLVGHQASVHALAVSPDGKMIASGGDDQTIKIWNQQGEILRNIPAHKERIWELAFSPDSQLLASASEDGTVKIWNIAGQLIHTLPHNIAVWGIVFHPHKPLLISSAKNNTLNFWQLDGTLIQSIHGKSDALNEMAISADGKIIAVAGVDNTVKLWDEEGNFLKTLSGHDGVVNTVAFTPDDKFIISGADDGTLIIWDIDQILSLDNLNYACNWVKDYLQTNVEVSPEQKQLCANIYNASPVQFGKIK
jgi:WD40 repeat protein